MQEQVKGILIDFKDAGWTVQKVEEALNFSNGTLGKVVSGKAGISGYRFSKLVEFHKEITKKNPTITEKLKEQITENNLPEKKVEIDENRSPTTPNRVQQMIEELKNQK